MALVQFSHANGFPAASYRSFFEALAPALEVHAIERIGMEPSYPVTDGWPHLVRQLIEAVRACPEPPILIGHSLGGLLSMQAAYALGPAVRGVVMLDAPVISRARAALLALTKWTGLGGRLPPAGLTRNRRDHWPDRAAARNHFQTRPLFAEFDPGALDDYVAGGLIEDGTGVRLAIDRAIETRIYRTIPHTLHRLAARPQPVPFGFLAGTRSRELALAGYAASRRFAMPHFRWFEGGHLFPMERPAEAAACLLALLSEMGILGARGANLPVTAPPRMAVGKFA
jgi:pimeloyl-ACP methyl ester carboxylesterase